MSSPKKYSDRESDSDAEEMARVQMIREDGSSVFYFAFRYFHKFIFDNVTIWMTILFCTALSYFLSKTTAI